MAAVNQRNNFKVNWYNPSLERLRNQTDKIIQKNIQKRRQQTTMMSFLDPFFNIKAQKKLGAKNWFEGVGLGLFGKKGVFDNFLGEWFRKPGQALVNDLQIIGNTLDYGANLIKAPLIASVKGEDVGQRLQDAYGLGNRGRVQQDMSEFRKALGCPASGTISGVLAGTMIGTQIASGWGTLIGAAVGVTVGGVADVMRANGVKAGDTITDFAMEYSVDPGNIAGTIAAPIKAAGTAKKIAETADAAKETLEETTKHMDDLANTVKTNRDAMSALYKDRPEIVDQYKALKETVNKSKSEAFNDFKTKNKYIKDSYSEAEKKLTENAKKYNERFGEKIKTARGKDLEDLQRKQKAYMDSYSKKLDKLKKVRDTSYNTNYDDYQNVLKTINDSDAGKQFVNIKSRLEDIDSQIKLVKDNIANAEKTTKEFFDQSKQRIIDYAQGKGLNISAEDAHDWIIQGTANFAVEQSASFKSAASIASRRQKFFDGYRKRIYNAIYDNDKKEFSKLFMQAGLHKLDEGTSLTVKQMDNIFNTLVKDMNVSKAYKVFHWFDSFDQSLAKGLFKITPMGIAAKAVKKGIALNKKLVRSKVLADTYSKLNTESFEAKNMNKKIDEINKGISDSNESIAKSNKVKYDKSKAAYQAAKEQYQKDYDSFMENVKKHNPSEYDNFKANFKKDYDFDYIPKKEVTSENRSEYVKNIKNAIDKQETDLENYYNTLDTNKHFSEETIKIIEEKQSKINRLKGILNNINLGNENRFISYNSLKSKTKNIIRHYYKVDDKDLNKLMKDDVFKAWADDIALILRDPDNYDVLDRIIFDLQYIATEDGYKASNYIDIILGALYEQSRKSVSESADETYLKYLTELTDKISRARQSSEESIAQFEKELSSVISMSEDLYKAKAEDLTEEAFKNLKNKRNLYRLGLLYGQFEHKDVKEFLDLLEPTSHLSGDLETQISLIEEYDNLKQLQSQLKYSYNAINSTSADRYYKLKQYETLLQDGRGATKKYNEIYNRSRTFVQTDKRIQKLMNTTDEINAYINVVLRDNLFNAETVKSSSNIDAIGRKIGDNLFNFTDKNGEIKNWIDIISDTDLVPADSLYAKIYNTNSWLDYIAEVASDTEDGISKYVDNAFKALEHQNNTVKQYGKTVLNEYINVVNKAIEELKNSNISNNLTEIYSANPDIAFDLDIRKFIDNNIKLYALSLDTKYLDAIKSSLSEQQIPDSVINKILNEAENTQKVIALSENTNIYANIIEFINDATDKYFLDKRTFNILYKKNNILEDLKSIQSRLNNIKKGKLQQSFIVDEACKRSIARSNAIISKAKSRVDEAIRKGNLGAKLTEEEAGAELLIQQLDITRKAYSELNSRIEEAFRRDMNYSQSLIKEATDNFLNANKKYNRQFAILNDIAYVSTASKLSDNSIFKQLIDGFSSVDKYLADIGISTDDIMKYKWHIMSGFAESIRINIEKNLNFKYIREQASKLSTWSGNVADKEYSTVRSLFKRLAQVKTSLALLDNFRDKLGLKSLSATANGSVEIIDTALNYIKNYAEQVYTAYKNMLEATNKIDELTSKRILDELLNINVNKFSDKTTAYNITKKDELENILYAVTNVYKEESSKYIKVGDNFKAINSEELAKELYGEELIITPADTRFNYSNLQMVDNSYGNSEDALDDIVSKKHIYAITTMDNNGNLIKDDPELLKAVENLELKHTLIADIETTITNDDNKDIIQLAAKSNDKTLNYFVYNPSYTAGAKADKLLDKAYVDGSMLRSKGALDNLANSNPNSFAEQTDGSLLFKDIDSMALHALDDFEKNGNIININGKKYIMITGHNNTKFDDGYILKALKKVDPSIEGIIGIDNLSIVQRLKSFGIYLKNIEADYDNLNKVSKLAYLLADMRVLKQENIYNDLVKNGMIDAIEGLAHNASTDIKYTETIFNLLKQDNIKTLNDLDKYIKHSYKPFKDLLDSEEFVDRVNKEFINNYSIIEDVANDLDTIRKELAYLLQKETDPTSYKFLKTYEEYILALKNYQSKLSSIVGDDKSHVLKPELNTISDNLVNTINNFKKLKDIKNSMIYGIYGDSCVIRTVNNQYVNHSMVQKFINLISGKDDNTFNILRGIYEGIITKDNIDSDGIAKFFVDYMGTGLQTLDTEVYGQLGRFYKHVDRVKAYADFYTKLDNLYAKHILAKGTEDPDIKTAYSTILEYLFSNSKNVGGFNYYLGSFYSKNRNKFNNFNDFLKEIKEYNAMLDVKNPANLEEALHIFAGDDETYKKLKDDIYDYIVDCLDHSDNIIYDPNYFAILNPQLNRTSLNVYHGAVRDMFNKYDAAYSGIDPTKMKIEGEKASTDINIAKDEYKIHIADLRNILSFKRQTFDENILLPEGYVSEMYNKSLFEINASMAPISYTRMPKGEAQARAAQLIKEYRDTIGVKFDIFKDSPAITYRNNVSISEAFMVDILENGSIQPSDIINIFNELDIIKKPYNRALVEALALNYDDMANKLTDNIHFNLYKNFVEEIAERNINYTEAAGKEVTDMAAQEELLLMHKQAKAMAVMMYYMDEYDDDIYDVLSSKNEAIKQYEQAKKYLNKEYDNTLEPPVKPIWEDFEPKDLEDYADYLGHKDTPDIKNMVDYTSNTLLINNQNWLSTFSYKDATGNTKVDYEAMYRYLQSNDDLELIAMHKSKKYRQGGVSTYLKDLKSNNKFDRTAGEINIINAESPKDLENLFNLNRDDIIVSILDKNTIQKYRKTIGHLGRNRVYKSNTLNKLVVLRDAIMHYICLPIKLMGLENLGFTFTNALEGMTKTLIGTSGDRASTMKQYGRAITMHKNWQNTMLEFEQMSGVKTANDVLMASPLFKKVKDPRKLIEYDTVFGNAVKNLGEDFANDNTFKTLPKYIQSLYKNSMELHKTKPEKYDYSFAEYIEGIKTRANQISKATTDKKSKMYQILNDDSFYDEFNYVNRFINSPAASAEYQSLMRADDIGAIENSTKSKGVDKIYNRLFFTEWAPVISPAFNMGLNSNIETINRLALDLDLFEKGFTESEALNRVLKTHFNYSNKSQLELTADMMFPFISFPLRTFMFWADALEEHPALIKEFADLMLCNWKGEENNPYNQGKISKGGLWLWGDVAIETGLSVYSSMSFIGNPIDALYNKKLNPLAGYAIEGIKSLALGEKSDKYDYRFSRLPVVSHIKAGVNLAESLSKNEIHPYTIAPSIFNRVYQNNGYYYRNQGRYVYKNIYNNIFYAHGKQRSINNQIKRNWK